MWRQTFPEESYCFFQVMKWWAGSNKNGTCMVYNLQIEKYFKNKKVEKHLMMFLKLIKLESLKVNAQPWCAFVEANFLKVLISLMKLPEQFLWLAFHTLVWTTLELCKNKNTLMKNVKKSLILKLMVTNGINYKLQEQSTKQLVVS